MLKKSVFGLGLLLLSSSALGQMLIKLDLTSDKEFSTQSVVVEDNQPATCKIGDLLFEVTAHKVDESATIALKIFRVSAQEQILFASPEFKTELNTPANLALEKDGQDVQLTLVAVEIV